MQCFPFNVDKCVNILGDMIINPKLDKAMIAEEKDTIKTELEESNKDTQETIMEAAHFNSYRDHMIGQPILGDIDNIENVTQDMVREYHATNYVGKNLVIVGTGNINHKQFVDMVANNFGTLNKNQPQGLEKKNTHKPIYTPSLMYMRDDELYNVGVGVFYEAPSWLHEDYYAMMLLERVLGNYSLEKNGQANLNDPHKQYSSLESFVGELPDVTKAMGIYSPYRDTGLFGSYYYGNEVFTTHMAYFGIYTPAHYGKWVN
jgi:mitochondrial-processing peptidase subunit beta